MIYIILLLSLCSIHIIHDDDFIDHRKKCKAFV